MPKVSTTVFLQQVRRVIIAYYLSRACTDGRPLRGAGWHITLNTRSRVHSTRLLSAWFACPESVATGVHFSRGMTQAPLPSVVAKSLAVSDTGMSSIGRGRVDGDLSRCCGLGQGEGSS
jgi:hypothetical protein